MTTLTVGDTAPTITGTASANLTGATLELHIKRPDKTVVTKAAAIVDGAAGTWSATLGAGDLNQAGTYYTELQVTFSNGKVQSFKRGSDNALASFWVDPEYA